MTDYVADCGTDFCIFMSFKSVGKSFGVTCFKAGSHRNDYERIQLKIG